MKYMTLFNLKIEHDYYADRCCTDFQIEPTPDTHRLLNAGRCVVKPLSHGLRVLAAVNEKNMPFVALPENPVFCFQLRLRNPDFDLFTDLTDIRKNEAPLFTNLEPSTDGELVLDSQKARNSERLTVMRPAAGEAFCLGGRPLENIKRADFNPSPLPDPLDPVALELAGKYRDKQCFYLISNGMVRCRHRARKNLQLKSGGETIMDALPNPLPHRYRKETADSPREYTLYHIQTCFTQ